MKYILLIVFLFSFSVQIFAQDTDVDQLEILINNTSPYPVIIGDKKGKELMTFTIVAPGEIFSCIFKKGKARKINVYSPSRSDSYTKFDSENIVYNRLVYDYSFYYARWSTENHYEYTLLPDWR